MIYIFCSTTKQARQNVLFIGGLRILSPDVIISKIEGTNPKAAYKNVQVKCIKKSPKNCQKSIKNSPKYSPKKVT